MRVHRVCGCMHIDGERSNARVNAFASCTNVSGTYGWWVAHTQLQFTAWFSSETCTSTHAGKVKAETAEEDAERIYGIAYHISSSPYFTKTSNNARW